MTLLLSSENIRYRLSLHEQADEESTRGWWAQHVGVPPEQFMRTTVKRHNPRTLRHNVGEHYHGCLVISVLHSRTLYQVLDGLVRGLVGSVQERPSVTA